MYSLTDWWPLGDVEWVTWAFVVVRVSSAPAAFDAAAPRGEAVRARRAV